MEAKGVLLDGVIEESAVDAVPSAMSELIEVVQNCDSPHMLTMVLVFLSLNSKCSAAFSLIYFKYSIWS